MKSKAYKVRKLKILVKKGDPWGDSEAQKSLSSSSSSFFLLCLLKKNKLIRLKDAQNHFKSTFGSAYLNSKKMNLKLAKQMTKEPRKARFPWDLGLLFVHPFSN